ncbi:TadA family conjugal transfer-associated ATPase [Agromyces lapidis]|uniref:TadA family conjugal transfer-associated ATPase n=1 Tax=Agromyces lapidis TaxID=279574 RepID=A0ABV5SRP4_9MICO|nr:TadA family conjugal transfer-associated ATPase [Agromyces lapidis]
MSIPFVATPSWQAAELAEPTAPPIPGATPSRAASQLATNDRFAEILTGFGPGFGPGPELAETGAAPPRIDLSALDALEPFASDGPVTDLFVNGGAGLWVDRGDGARREPGWSAEESEVRALAVKLIARGGRHVDEATPTVDVRLGLGIRVHVVLPPVSTGGTLISVRIPRAAGRSLAELAGTGMLDDAQRELLELAVRERRNLLVTGAGGTGKTTMLAAMLSGAPAHERIVVIEDVAELQLAHPHVVSLEARQANLEGSGRIGLDALLREALRMRPDRLVVGECRGAELRELLAALNTGHDGGAGTLHANSLADVPARLEALGATAGLSPDAVARQTASAFDLVLHLERVDGCRRLAQIGRFALRDDRLGVEPL